MYPRHQFQKTAVHCFRAYDNLSPCEYKELFEVITTGVVALSIFVYGTVLWVYFTFYIYKKRSESLNFQEVEVKK